MTQTPLTELPELMHWLHEAIDPIQGQQWQITLNSSGGVVDATLKVVQSQNDNGRGHRTTISKVVSTKFRLRPVVNNRIVFSTD